MSSETVQAARNPDAKVKLALPDRAYREIKRRILENDMPSGTIMLESELAELLDMSRTPIREALIRLSNEGMVEVRPRHGMRVLPVSKDDMIEIYDILTALEAQAAELVARRGLSPEQLAELNDAVDEMDHALANDDLTGWANADERFHLLLVEFCGNRRLSNMVNTFWDQSHRVRLLTLRLRPKPTGSNDDHRAVVAAIANGNPDAARDLHRQHRLKSGTMLVEILENHGLSNV
ncbi:GntR family transcriptional regulator [Thalassospira lucentensis]|uniref:GntR family transcriptional regulator n=1 Tax=Thalassospira lucentensis TaxID=168935 RepID=UPI003D2F0C37